MKKRRIKFYGPEDWSCGSSLIEAERILDSFDLQFEYTDINDILELYNIQLFFKNEIYLSKWTMEERKRYAETAQKFSRVIGKFASQLCDDNIINQIHKISYGIKYEDSFWDVFETYKVYKRISGDVFAEILRLENNFISVILRHPKTVESYGVQIADSFKKRVELVKLIIDWHWSDRFCGMQKKQMYFPKILTIRDREEIIDKFIEESDDTNYLDLIANSHNIKNELEISDRIRLAARRKSEKWKQEYFKTHIGIDYSIRVCFDQDQQETIAIQNRKGGYSISYGTQFIEENLDYPTLLNNFIYLFNYADLFGRCTLVHKYQDLSILERTLGIHVKNQYYKGIVFEQRQAIADMQLMAYVNILEQHNIRFENIVTWFYTEYLKDEFNVQGFEIHMPSECSTYLEKCRTICAEIESVLKQYKSFVENGYIDQELISMNSTPVSVKDIPSLNENKYIYLSKSSDTIRIINLIFSDQTMIYSMDHEKSMGDNFYLTIQNGMWKRHEFGPQNEVDWLIEHDILDLQEEYLVWKSKNMMDLLYDLFYNEVSPYILWKYQSTETVHEAFNKGWIRYESSFLSRPEQDYFNYMMNRKDFGNSLDLRNLYLHGTQGHDENTHKNHYYKFLELLIILIIKINDDLCVYEENNKEI